MSPITERVRLGRYLRISLTVCDYVVLNVAYLLALLILGQGVDVPLKFVWLLVNVSFIPSEVFYASTHDVRILYADRVVLTAFKSTVLLACVSMTLLYIFGLTAMPFSAALVFYCIFFVLLSIWWLLSRSILKRFRRIGFNFKRVMVIGTGATGRAVIRELQSDAGYGYKILGVFDRKIPKYSDRTGDWTHGVLDDVANFVHENRIDVIYYTLDGEDSDLLAKMMLVSEEEGADFVFVPKISKFVAGRFQISSIGNIPSMTHTLSPLHRRRNQFAKRVEDLLISVPFLAVSPILFVPIAIGIKLTSPGPIFFKQKRTGIYGSEFYCYKFRTMHVNPDSDLIQASKDDPRKTKFGDFLRRSSLDELPQFINVFLGNMSVVGPRPHMISHTEEYSALIDKYMVRHAVKPGITGWAQVNGYRGGTRHLWQMEKRVEYDVWYIRNWNLFLDLKVIFLTVWNVFRGEENAY